MKQRDSIKISLKELSFYYGDFQALDDISFDVSGPMRFLALWGRPKAAKARC
jgi:ABC-type phosphate transport system ATPase subunit